MKVLSGSASTYYKRLSTSVSLEDSVYVNSLTPDLLTSSQTIWHLTAKDMQMTPWQLIATEKKNFDDFLLFIIVIVLISKIVLGNEVYLPQIRSERVDPATRCALRDGAQHHTRKDLHYPVVLVAVPLHCFPPR